MNMRINEPGHDVPAFRINDIGCVLQSVPSDRFQSDDRISLEEDGMKAIRLRPGQAHEMHVRKREVVWRKRVRSTSKQGGGRQGRA